MHHPCQLCLLNVLPCQQVSALLAETQLFIAADQTTPCVADAAHCGSSHADAKWRPKGARSDCWFDVLQPPTPQELKASMQSTANGMASGKRALGSSDGCLSDADEEAAAAAAEGRPAKRQKQDFDVIDLAGTDSDDEQPAKAQQQQQQQQQQPRQPQPQLQQQQQQQAGEGARGMWNVAGMPSRMPPGLTTSQPAAAAGARAAAAAGAGHRSGIQGASAGKQPLLLSHENLQWLDIPLGGAEHLRIAQDGQPLPRFTASNAQQPAQVQEGSFQQPRGGQQQQQTQQQQLGGSGGAVAGQPGSAGFTTLLMRDDPDTTQQQQQQNNNPAARHSSPDGTRRRASSGLGGFNLPGASYRPWGPLVDLEADSDFHGTDSSPAAAAAGAGGAGSAAGTHQNANGMPAGQQQQQRGTAAGEGNGENPAAALHNLWRNEPATYRDVDLGSDFEERKRQLQQRLQERRLGPTAGLQAPVLSVPTRQMPTRQLWQAGSSKVVEVIELLSDSE
jgi:hypothetical protein